MILKPKRNNGRGITWKRKLRWNTGTVNYGRIKGYFLTHQGKTFRTKRAGIGEVRGRGLSECAMRGTKTKVKEVEEEGRLDG